GSFMDDASEPTAIAPFDVLVTVEADQDRSDHGEYKVGHGIGVARLHRRVGFELEVDHKLIYLPHRRHGQRGADRQEGGEKRGRPKVDAGEEYEKADEDDQSDTSASHAMQDQIPPPERVIEIDHL